MATAGGVGEFDTWLNVKLKAFDTDEGVFGDYIRGILEGEESPEEKKEALESILSEMTENDISTLCQEIIEKWNLFTSQNGTGPNSVLAPEDVDVKLARLMESQARATTVRSSNYTDEEKRIREAILTQYGQYSDEEGEGTSHPTPGPAPVATKASLERNTNAALVAQAEREKREQSRVESQKKKEKDKEDREKQKQTQADKKEKRKTQKGERRR